MKWDWYLPHTEISSNQVKEQHCYLIYITDRIYQGYVHLKEARSVQLHDALQFDILCIYFLTWWCVSTFELCLYGYSISQYRLFLGFLFILLFISHILHPKHSFHPFHFSQDPLHYLPTSPVQILLCFPLQIKAGYSRDIHWTWPSKIK